MGRWAETNWPWDQLVGPAWDVFYLFDRDVTWDTSREEVIATGYTIVGRRDALAEGLEQVFS